MQDYQQLYEFLTQTSAMLIAIIGGIVGGLLVSKYSEYESLQSRCKKMSELEKSTRKRLGITERNLGKSTFRYRELRKLDMGVDWYLLDSGASVNGDYGVLSEMDMVDYENGKISSISDAEKLVEEYGLWCKSFNLVSTPKEWLRFILEIGGDISDIRLMIASKMVISRIDSEMVKMNQIHSSTESWSDVYSQQMALIDSALQDALEEEQFQLRDLRSQLELERGTLERYRMELEMENKDLSGFVLPSQLGKSVGIACVAGVLGVGMPMVFFYWENLPMKELHPLFAVASFAAGVIGIWFSIRLLLPGRNTNVRMEVSTAN